MLTHSCFTVDITHSFVPGSKYTSAKLPDTVSVALLQLYNTTPGAPKVYSSTDQNVQDMSLVIKSRCLVYKSFVIHSRSMVPINKALRKSAKSALVRAHWNNKLWYGEIMDIISHQQPGHTPQTVAEMRWMKQSGSLVKLAQKWNTFQ